MLGAVKAHNTWHFIETTSQLPLEVIGYLHSTDDDEVMTSQHDTASRKGIGVGVILNTK